MPLTGRLKRLENKQVFISYIVPAYNEEPVIAAFLKALNAQAQQLSQQYEIIVVDDASKDQTYQAVLSFTDTYPVKLLRFSRNFGKEIALSAGLQHASGEVVVLIDGDFQHPMEVIPQFLKHWAEGYDMVYGVRKSRGDESRIKRSFARFFYRLMERITNVSIPPNAGDFRLLDRCVVDSLNQIDERSRFMKGLYAWVGYSSMAVPFDVQERAAGQSSWSFIRLVELAITGITSFSEIPLRFWGVIGFAISLISFIYALCIIGETLFFGAKTPGFATLIVAIMFLGGIQLLSIGILGEYIGRIFNEVKQRPLYIISKKIGF
jgi:glycosyltransferase involved in cell wall biosynthesis